MKFWFKGDRKYLNIPDNDELQCLNQSKLGVDCSNLCDFSNQMVLTFEGFKARIRKERADVMVL